MMYKFDFMTYMLKVAENMKDFGHSPSNKKFYRVSSLIGLEELLSSLTEADGTILVVSDNQEGRFLDVSSNNLGDHQFHQFYVLKRVPNINDYDTIELYKADTRATRSKILGKMWKDRIQGLNGLTALDFTSISYFDVGPVATYFFGTHVNFTVTNIPGIQYNPNDWINAIDFQI